MTSPERINASRATPGATSVSTPKAAPAGADDFAATLTQARDSSNAASAVGAATQETQPEGTASTGAPRSTKNPRSARDPKESDRENVVAGAEPLPTELVVALNAVASPPAAAPARVPPDGEVAARSAVPESDASRAVLVIADTSSGESSEGVKQNGGAGAVRRAPRASAPVSGAPSPEANAVLDTPVGQGTAPAVAAQVDRGVPAARTAQVARDAQIAAGAPVTRETQTPTGAPVRGVQTASQPVSNGRLGIEAGALRAGLAQPTEQTADRTALAVVTDVLQATTRLADATVGNATLDASAPTSLNVASDTAANAALSQLTTGVSASDASPLTRGAQSIPQHTLPTTVGAQGWNDELATRLTWMVDQQQQAATLRLSPENLGPLEVRIDVRENQVSVWFGAAQADTRAAIESALPRLRELLQGQGLSLADAGVSQQSHRESPRNLAPGAAFSDVEEASEMNVALRVGLFDGYA